MSKTIKRVPTIGITVIRDGKRETPKIGLAFAFTEDEIKSVTKQHPTAFRKPVNEDTDLDGVTTPDGVDHPTGTETPKRSKREKAAQKDSTSEAATGEEKSDGQSSKAAGEDDEDDDI